MIIKTNKINVFPYYFINRLPQINKRIFIPSSKFLLAIKSYFTFHFELDTNIIFYRIILIIINTYTRMYIVYI